MADLEETITVTRKAVELTTADHPDRVIWLNNLGRKLQSRYERTGEMADLEEAIRVTRQAVASTPANHPARALYLNSLGKSRSWRPTKAVSDQSSPRYRRWRLH